jgi:hypothetical protein
MYYQCQRCGKQRTSDQSDKPLQDFLKCVCPWTFLPPPFELSSKVNDVRFHIGRDVQREEAAKLLGQK